MDRQHFAWRNRFVEQLNQTIQGVDCFTPFVDINTDDNQILLNLNAIQFQQIFDSLIVGADVAYPDISHQIVLNFLKGLHCPVSMPSEDGDCFNYPPYAPFLEYSPMNPFQDPLAQPVGYVSPPFTIHSGISPLYQDGDVIVPFNSLPLLSENWLEILLGALPQIVINTVGDGQIEIDLLNTLLGGFIIIKVGSPPNILDIFTGTIDPNVWIVDTQIDVAIPSEVAIVQSREVNIEVGTGVTEKTYLTWIPAIDDSAIPIRFGGGLRQVGLCGFENSGVIMGITDLRRVGEKLETFEGGVWTEKVDLAPLHAVLQNQITANDGDIASLQAADTIIQNRITVNETDIQTVYLENDNQQTEIDSLALGQQQQQLTIDQNSADIDVNEIDIATNALDIANDQLATTSLNNEVNDLWIESNNQNTRITTLENAPSGTGGGSMKTSVYTISLTANQDTIAWKELLLARIDHQFVYSKALITCSFRMASLSTLNTVTVSAKMQIDGVDTMIQTSLANALVGLFAIAHNAENLSTSLPTEISLHWQGIGSSARFVKTQAIVYTIIEYEDAVVLTNPLVTFDAGGDQYTSIGNVGIVSSGGNPNNCLFAQSVAQNNYMEIEVDVPLNWTHFEMSLFTDDLTNLGIQLLLDGVPKHNVTGYTLNNQWETNSNLVNTAETGTWSVRVTASFGAVADMRIDNIRFFEI